MKGGREKGRKREGKRKREGGTEKEKREKVGERKRERDARAKLVCDVLYFACLQWVRETIPGKGLKVTPTLTGQVNPSDKVTHQSNGRIGTLRLTLTQRALCPSLR